jgi:para-nitrobenzyl esterase
MTMKIQAILPIVLYTFVLQCQTPAQSTTWKIAFSPSPIDLGSVEARFAKDIAYGPDSLQRFDLFLPEKASKPCPLVVFIHGGGFTNGDKSEIYNIPKRAEDIKSLLGKGIAFANINYRLLRPGNKTGVRLCLDDVKYCLQFIRHHGTASGIDTANMAGYGYSAGGSAALWLGLHTDLKDGNATDRVLHQSTRLKAVVARETQASLDLQQWADEVFKDFSGLDLNAIVAMSGGPKIYGFYGISSPADFNRSDIVAYRQDIDFLRLMDAADSPLWVENDNPSPMPTKRGELFHHPNHAKALKLRADAAGLPCTAHIPALAGYTTLTESHLDFLARLLGK